MEEFFRLSTVTGKSYDVFKTIKLLNHQQVAFYMSCGVELRDVRLSYSKKNNTPILVYYFYKEETKDAYDKWCAKRDDST